MIRSRLTLAWRVVGPRSQYLRSARTTDGGEIRWQSNLTSAKLTLPKTSNLIYFLARGAQAEGEIAFGAVPDADDIQITVALPYTDERARNSVRLCIMKDEQGGYGMAIYVRNFLLCVSATVNRLEDSCR